MRQAFIKELQAAFEAQRNPQDAAAMTAYMKGQFSFYGVKATPRRLVLKTVVDAHKEVVAKDVRWLAKTLYGLSERELHMCAIELVQKHLKKRYLEEDIHFIEFLLTTHAWWDSVDVIAKQILGPYLTQFPESKATVIERFSASGHLWLQRSTILFQLGYKTNTDTALLFQQCIRFKDSNEFFLQKAIGWALREYGKIDGPSVINFVNSTALKPLSQKEALKNL